MIVIARKEEIGNGGHSVKEVDVSAFIKCIKEERQVRFSKAGIVVEVFETVI